MVLSGMVRDFDLIRKLLLQIEAVPAGKIIQAPDIPVDDGVTAPTYGQHIHLLFDAGLVDGQMVDSDEPMFVITRLTWKGHDFISNARNDTIWKKVLAEAKQKGSSLTMVILNGLLEKAAEKYAGLG
jgi:hypothetical protein